MSVEQAIGREEKIKILAPSSKNDFQHKSHRKNKKKLERKIFVFTKKIEFFLRFPFRSTTYEDSSRRKVYFSYERYGITYIRFH